MKCQNDFEAHIRSLGGDYNLLKVGDVYIDVETQIEWRTWQKAWQAALASQQPADDGWIEWAGGVQPVADDVMVEVLDKDRRISCIHGASAFRWQHGAHGEGNDGYDIIAYRVVKP